eukprot:scaffold1833_cov185-Ochromonas_danica.AAC.1
MKSELVKPSDGKSTLRDEILRLLDEYERQGPQPMSEGFTEELQRPGCFAIPSLRRQPRWSIPYVQDTLSHYSETLLQDFRANHSCLPCEPIHRDVIRGSWMSYYLMKEGKWCVERGGSVFQRTLQVLSMLPIMENGLGYVYYSELSPGTEIRGHCGPTNAKIRALLPLLIEAEHSEGEGEGVSVSERSRSVEEEHAGSLDVAGDVRLFKAGEVQLFDDSFFHSVRNSSSCRRLALIIDLWHPDISDEDLRGQISRVFSSSWEEVVPTASVATTHATASAHPIHPIMAYALLDDGDVDSALVSGCDHPTIVDHALDYNGEAVVLEEDRPAAAAVLATTVEEGSVDEDGLEKKKVVDEERLFVNVVNAAGLIVPVRSEAKLNQGQQEYDFLFKFLMIGDTGCGKSCFLLRAMDNVFSMDFNGILGASFKTKTYHLLDPEDGTTSAVKLELWDTAGPERFRALSPLYYRGAHGVFLFYSVYDRQSFELLTYWLGEVEKYATRPNPCILLVGLQADVTPMTPDELVYHVGRYGRNRVRIGVLERAVTYEEGQAFAAAHHMPFLEVSSKDDFQVQDAVVSLAYMVLRRAKTDGTYLITQPYRPQGNHQNQQRQEQQQRCSLS